MEVREGTAPMIKKIIKHHAIEKKIEYLQASSVTIAEKYIEMIISSIYCLPAKKAKQLPNLITEVLFFKSWGNNFITGGDLIAKHQTWGSRIIKTGCRELLKAITANNLKKYL